jgi:hypothetical protein
MSVHLLIRLCQRFVGAPSPSYETFRAYVEGDRAEVGGCGLDALARLGPRERRRAERLLMRAPPDARVVEALGVLASARAARRLRALFRRERAQGGPVMIAAAAALWRQGPREEYVCAVIGRLRGAAARAERMDAAAALGVMACAEAQEALTAALEDRDALVRHFAARALLELHGVAVDSRAIHEIVYRGEAGGETGRREAGAA